MCMHSKADDSQYLVNEAINFTGRRTEADDSQYLVNDAIAFTGKPAPPLPRRPPPSQPQPHGFEPGSLYHEPGRSLQLANLISFNCLFATIVS
jgi:hypothetical protein